MWKLDEILKEFDSGKRKPQDIVDQIILKGTVTMASSDQVEANKQRLEAILGASELEQLLSKANTVQEKLQLKQESPASELLASHKLETQENHEPSSYYELGKKDEISGSNLLKPLYIDGRPYQMPLLSPGHKVICWYDQGLGQRLFVCNNLSAMQELYDNYSRGGALFITWYTGEDPGFIHVM